MTREEKYRQQLKELGVYKEIFEPEIKALARLERELQRAQKEWSKTASPPGSQPSFLDPHYATIQKLNADILRHREAMGMTPLSLRKLMGAQPEGPDQKELISAALDRIADSVAGFDPGSGSGSAESEKIDLDKLLAARDAYADLPGFHEAQEIGEAMDAEDYDLKQAVAEDMG